MMNEKLTAASVVAQIMMPEIMLGCMSVAREDGMPEWRARHRLAEARGAAERILVAILAAEQSIAPPATSTPANDDTAASVEAGT